MLMAHLVIPKMKFVAPNGEDSVIIHPDGYVEFDEAMSDETREIVAAVSNSYANTLGNVTPPEVFMAMGWVREVVLH